MAKKLITKKVLRLGIECTERVTGAVGHLTHRVLFSDGSVEYHFKKKGKAESGNLYQLIRVRETSIETKESNPYERISVPTDLFFIKVSEKLTGGEDTIVAIEWHLNGCIHFILASPRKDTDEKVLSTYSAYTETCSGKELDKIREKYPDFLAKPVESPMQVNYSPYTV